MSDDELRGINSAVDLLKQFGIFHSISILDPDSPIGIDREYILRYPNDNSRLNPRLITDGSATTNGIPQFSCPSITYDVTGATYVITYSYEDQGIYGQIDLYATLEDIVNNFDQVLAMSRELYEAIDHYDEFCSIAARKTITGRSVKIY